MADTVNDPLGIESIMKTLTQSMSEMASFQDMFHKPFFNPSSDESVKTPFYWPFQSGSSDSKDSVGSEGSENKKEKRKDIMSAIATAMKNWQTMASAMSSPESISALLKGVGTMPEMLVNMTQSTISGVAEIQQKIAASASRMGQSVQAYKFDNIDENIFKAWSEIYEKEFRKFFRIPQLGLAREYQERMNDMADKLNIAQTNVTEFLRMLSLPFQRAAVVMQEEVQMLAENGKLSEDPQFYYQMWLKILEGHFMTLFQTPEYIESLTKTVESMSLFNGARERVIEDMLKQFPVASRSDIDDMAKELHQLKRELRNIKRQIENQAAGGAV